MFLSGLEKMIIFHYTFKATQGLKVSRFCMQVSKTFSLQPDTLFSALLTNASQKVNKDIKYPDKTLKGKCVCSLCTTNQPSGDFSSTGVESAERRGEVSAGWTEQKRTGQSCLLYVDLEQQTKSHLSLKYFFACLDWSVRDHSWLVTVHFAETLLKAVTASLVPNVFQSAHFKCTFNLISDSSHQQRLQD